MHPTFRILFSTGTLFALLCTSTAQADSPATPAVFQGGMSHISTLVQLIQAQPHPASVQYAKTVSGLPVLYTAGATSLMKIATTSQLAELTAIYRHDAEQGDAPAQFSLAIIHTSG